ncbi:MAG TPA: alpha/beta hydrolase, partial [Variovorax sp.]|nr:alpha/beta hydrolase [Variovorax sp.]
MSSDLPVPSSHYAQLAGREIHWLDWGAPDAPVVIAWHGLARTCRDMDELAQHFAARGFRVICPDTIGRGLSQWSPLPDEEYQLSFYARIAGALCDELR